MRSRCAGTSGRCNAARSQAMPIVELSREVMDDCPLAQPLGTAIASLRHGRAGMRIGQGGRRWMTRWLLAGVGIALVAGPGDAQRFEYVITFNNVAVQGIKGSVDTPEVAHLEVPGMEKSSTSAEKGDDRGKPIERPPGQLPKVIARSPDYPLPFALPFAPGQGANPSFVQEGFLVEAFWAVKTGKSDAYFLRAHFHPADLSTGFEAQHLGHPNELHGLFIRSLDGKRFGLKSLRYRVTRNRQIPNKPVSIEGFNNFSVSVLVARSFDPRAPILVQFVTFPVGMPVGNDPKLPWFTLRIFGFELVDQLFIGSSASVDLDDIVLTRSEPPPRPKEQPEEDK